MGAILKGDGETNYFKYDPNKYGDNENTRIMELSHKRITKKEILKEQLKKKSINLIMK